MLRDSAIYSRFPDDINVSYAQIAGGNVEDDIIETIKEHALDPANIWRRDDGEQTYRYDDTVYQVSPQAEGQQNTICNR